MIVSNFEGAALALAALSFSVQAEACGTPAVWFSPPLMVMFALVLVVVSRELALDCIPGLSRDLHCAFELRRQRR